MTLPAPVAAATPAQTTPSIASRRGELGAVLAAVAVVVGTRIGEHPGWAAGTARAGVLIAGCPAVVLFAARRLNVRAAWRAAGLVCLAALGAVSMARALSGLDGLSSRLAAGDFEGMAAVRLAADPHGRWTSARVPARLVAVDGVGARGNVLVVASRAAAERVLLLETGESAVLLGYFRPLQEEERRWRWRHVAAVFEAHDLVGAGRPESAVLRVANALRHRVLAGGAALNGTDRALVGGFLVGDDRGLPARVAADFRAAGLSHLLVVSGANVSLALALVGPLLRRFGLLGRLTGGAAVLVVFTAMTRFEPSVLRAGTMSGLALLASFLGRPVAGLRILALSVAALALVDPFLVHSLGFGLSVGASAGILLLAAPIERLLRGPRWIRDPLAVTAAAQIGVAPIALQAFGELPLVALPANLLAAPAAAALSLWGLGAGIVTGLLEGSTGGADSGPLALLQSPTALLAGWIRMVARLAASAPVMISPRTATLGALVVSVFAWRRGRLRRTRQPAERAGALASPSSGSPTPDRGSASRPKR